MKSLFWKQPSHDRMGEMLLGPPISTLVMESPYNPAVALLMCIPEKWRLNVHTETYTQMFYSSFIRISPKPPNCPSTGAWFNQLWSFHTKEDDPALKVLVHEPPENDAEWEKAIPKVTCRMIPLLWPLWRQNLKTGGKIARWQALRREWGRKGLRGDRVFRFCALSCQCPGCDLLLWFGKTLPLGKMSKGSMKPCWIIFYNYNWIYSCLKIWSFNFKKKEINKNYFRIYSLIAWCLILWSSERTDLLLLKTAQVSDLFNFFYIALSIQSIFLFENSIQQNCLTWMTSLLFPNSYIS